jgi:hypothetical protein
MANGTKPFLLHKAAAFLRQNAHPLYFFTEKPNEPSFSPSDM